MNNRLTKKEKKEFIEIGDLMYEDCMRFNGDYTGDKCPECGRERIMLCQDGKRHCEKCWWCIEDEEYQGEFEAE